MGRKSVSGGVEPLGERIQLTFYYRLQRVRPTLNLRPTEPNLKFARRRLEEIKAQIRAGTFDFAREFPDYKGLARFGVAAPVAKTIGDYIDAWTTANSRLKPSTLNGYRKIFRRYWRAWFGDRAPSAIAFSEVAVKMGEQPWGSNRTFNNVLSCGRVVWEMACKDDPKLVNLPAQIEMLDVQDVEPDPFTIEEIDLMLPKVRERWGAEAADYCEFAFFSGLRPCEQIELRWTDVDLAASTARIQRARFKKQVREVKNYDARVLELHSRARGALDRQAARTRLAGGLVWLHPRTGRPFADERAQRLHWAPALKLAGLRHREPYQTRHSYATMLLMSGANPTWAAKQMGHSPQVFFKIYARWIEAASRGTELAKVERFTDSGSVPNTGIELRRGAARTGKSAGK